MRVIITKDYDEMSRKAAEFIVKELKNKPDSILCLATGTTPVSTYKELVRLYKDKKVDFSKVSTFNLDEYYGLADDHPQSYHYFMNEHLFRHINLKKSNSMIPDGKVKDIEKYCFHYEWEIKQKGGIDLQLLGLGRDGHVGFNEPGSSLGSRTRLKTLTEETVEDNSRFFKKKDEVPRYVLTMGIGTIMEAKKILLLVSGENKAGVLQKVVEGPITSMVPASALQMHRNVILIADEAAASRLSRKDYYVYVEKMQERHEKGEI
ncbi:MAG: glucosamine-6-phosphate deaminase [Candidatus Saganbacteria bacterium]|nr:glucosamine-6-phosphate deaminase [Candidatus Saganbacteria bacterium]